MYLPAAVVLLLLPPLLLQSYLPLPAAGAADLLQLAMNRGSFESVVEKLNRIPVQLDAPAAHRLLLTAVVRHDRLLPRQGEMVKRLVDAPAVRQHIDAPTLSAVLDLLFPLRSHKDWWLWKMFVKKRTRDLQARALEMGGDANIRSAMELLPADIAMVIAADESDFARPLFQLANVQQLPVEILLELLSAAVDKFYLDLDDDDNVLVGHLY
jgi:hypothetical protein